MFEYRTVEEDRPYWGLVEVYEIVKEGHTVIATCDDEQYALLIVNALNQRP